VIFLPDFDCRFGHLLLGYIVVALLTVLAAVPGAAIMAVPVITMVRHQAFEAVPFLVALLGSW